MASCGSFNLVKQKLGLKSVQSVNVRSLDSWGFEPKRGAGQRSTFGKQNWLGGKDWTPCEDAQ